MFQELKRFYKFISTHPIGSKSQLLVWQRWLRWQLSSRLIQAPIVMPWLDEACLIVEKGMTGATGNIYCGLHEFANMALLLHYFGLDPGIFLDVGANIGSYTILASKVCKTSVIALEPVPSTFTKLARNVAVNQVQDIVDLKRVAAGETLGELQFSCDQDTTNQVVDETYSGKKTKVATQPLDKILASRTANFWKIDVEGFEHEVLAGASSALLAKELEVVLLEANDDTLSEIMRNSGFNQYNYDPFSRQFTATKSSVSFSNHTWIRNIDAVIKRCQNAPRRKIYNIEF